MMKNTTKVPLPNNDSTEFSWEGIMLGVVLMLIFLLTSCTEEKSSFVIDFSSDATMEESIGQENLNSIQQDYLTANEYLESERVNKEMISSSTFIYKHDAVPFNYQSAHPLQEFQLDKGLMSEINPILS